MSRRLLEVWIERADKEGEYWIHSSGLAVPRLIVGWEAAIGAAQAELKYAARVVEARRAKSND